MTPTGEEEEPLNALTSNSNGNGNGERLLSLKNVCLNFGNNENSGLITPPINTTETLTIIKNVDCQVNMTFCSYNPISSSDFTILIEGNNPSQTSFPGSSTGTDVELEAGSYNVTEEGLDPTIPEICSDYGI